MFNAVVALWLPLIGTTLARNTAARSRTCLVPAAFCRAACCWLGCVAANVLRAGLNALPPLLLIPGFFIPAPRAARCACSCSATRLRLQFVLPYVTQLLPDNAHLAAPCLGRTDHLLVPNMPHGNLPVLRRRRYAVSFPFVHHLTVSASIAGFRVLCFPRFGLDLPGTGPSRAVRRLMLVRVLCALGFLLGCTLPPRYHATFVLCQCTAFNATPPARATFARLFR